MALSAEFRLTCSTVVMFQNMSLLTSAKGSFIKGGRTYSAMVAQQEEHSRKRQHAQQEADSRTWTGSESFYKAYRIDVTQHREVHCGKDDDKDDRDGLRHQLRVWVSLGHWAYRRYDQREKGKVVPFANACMQIRAVMVDAVNAVAALRNQHHPTAEAIDLTASRAVARCPAVSTGRTRRQ